MGTAELAKLLKKSIRLNDSRTGTEFYGVIDDVRTMYGKIRLKLEKSTVWFEPTRKELETVC
jgi:hypothetical protein